MTDEQTILRIKLKPLMAKAERERKRKQWKDAANSFLHMCGGFIVLGVIIFVVMLAGFFSGWFAALVAKVVSE